MENKANVTPETVDVMPEEEEVALTAREVLDAPALLVNDIASTLCDRVQRMASIEELTALACSFNEFDSTMRNAVELPRCVLFAKVRECKVFKPVYKNFHEWAKKNFELSPASADNYANVAKLLDYKTAHTIGWNGGKDFGYTQLSNLMYHYGASRVDKLRGDLWRCYSPEMSVADIKAQAQAECPKEVKDTKTSKAKQVKTATPDVTSDTAPDEMVARDGDEVMHILRLDEEETQALIGAIDAILPLLKEDAPNMPVLMSIRGRLV